MVCESCREVGKSIKRGGGRCLRWTIGSVADVRQRAAICQICQTISELLRPVSKKATDVVHLKDFIRDSLYILLLQKKRRLGEPSQQVSTSELEICYFIRNDKSLVRGVPIGKKRLS